MAPDQLGGVSSAGTVSTAANRPGGKGSGLAQGQAAELSVGALVCRARLSRQTGHGEHGQEDTRDRWGTLGYPGEESHSRGAHWPVAELPASTLTAALHPEEKRQTAPALDPRPD